MRTNDLFEMALPSASEARVREVRAILTPDVYAKNYELVTGLLAAGLSFGDLDELKLTLDDKLMSNDEVKFQLKMMAKKVTYKLNAQSDTLIGGWLNTKHKNGASRSWFIQFNRGRWTVGFNVNDIGYPSDSKKFEQPEDAIEWFLKRAAMLEANPEKW